MLLILGRKRAYEVSIQNFVGMCASDLLPMPGLKQVGQVVSCHQKGAMMHIKQYVKK